MLSADRKIELTSLAQSLRINNVDLNLLELALTHPSFNFESGIENGQDYERLEFLGDSVLRLSVSEMLFDNHKDYDEGKLTKIRSTLVSDKFLCTLAGNLEISKYIKLGKSEDKDGGRFKESIQACVMEAVIGAVYKSCGFESAKKYVYKIYENAMYDVNSAINTYNSKEMLQEYTQGKNKDLPEYKIVSENGPAHEKIYETAVLYHGEELGRGSAGTKKEAEKLAALNALKKLKLIKED